jgi:hypothetical protein
MRCHPQAEYLDIQDAVAAANLLARPLKERRLCEPDLGSVRYLRTENSDDFGEHLRAENLSLAPFRREFL